MDFVTVLAETAQRRPVKLTQETPAAILEWELRRNDAVLCVKMRDIPCKFVTFLLLGEVFDYNSSPQELLLNLSSIYREKLAPAISKRLATSEVQQVLEVAEVMGMQIRYRFDFDPARSKLEAMSLGSNLGSIWRQPVGFDWDPFREVAFPVTTSWGEEIEWVRTFDDWEHLYTFVTRWERERGITLFRRAVVHQEGDDE